MLPSSAIRHPSSLQSSVLCNTKYGKNWRCAWTRAVGSVVALFVANLIATAVLLGLANLLAWPTTLEVGAAIQLGGAIVGATRSPSQVSQSSCRSATALVLSSADLPPGAITCATTDVGSIAGPGYNVLIDGGTKYTAVAVRVISRSGQPFNDLQAAANLARAIYRRQVARLAP